MDHALTIYRKTHGLTLETFGELIGASKSMISKWESGDATPRRHFIEKIYEVTSGAITANDFFLPNVTFDSSPIPEAAE